MRCIVIGEEFNLSCGPAETIGTLKEKICDEIRFSLSSVKLYCGPCLLTDADFLVTNLLEFTNSFLLELPEAGEIEIESEKDVFLLTGSSKKFNAPLRIPKTKERNVKIKAHQNKFGIVTHENVNSWGRKSYQVERYQVKGKGKVTVKISETSGEVLVFLRGEEDPLVPLVMTYVEKVGFRNPLLMTSKQSITL